MRIRIAFIALMALAACGRSETPPATTEAPPPAPAPAMVAWSDLEASTITVPDGVFYALVDNNGTQVAEIAAVPADATSGLRTGGVSVRLPAEFEREASGKRIRVVVRAQATDPGAVLGVAYSTSEVGNSGWRQFNLTTAPADYAFQYNVGEVDVGRGDYLGFRSYGDGRVQILGFRTEVIGPHLLAPEQASQ